MSLRIWPLIGVLLAVGFAPAPLHRRGAAEGGDARKFQGEWVVIERYQNGRKLAPQPGDLTRLSIVGGRWAFSAGGDVRSRWSATLDPAASPRTVDLRSTDRPEIVVPAIYRLEGGRLSFCYGGSNRPTSFDTKGGRWLLVLQRP